jgi:hypothetical protein
LAEDKTLNEIASANNLSPKNLRMWKKQFLENAEIAMEPGVVAPIKSQPEFPLDFYFLPSF